MRLEVVVLGQDSLLHQHALQRVHEVQEALGARVAHVVHAVRSQGQPVGAGSYLGRVPHDARHGLHHVLDVGEVAHAVAHVEDLDGLAAHELLGEPEVGHVGPAHGAVDSEEPQARRRDRVELGVGVGHELVRLLGGRVEGHRRVHAVLLGEGHLLVAAVDGARGRVHEVPDRMPAARLQHVEEAHEV